MSGPWEKYKSAAPAAAGPWQKYQQQGEWRPVQRGLADLQAMAQPQDVTDDMNFAQTFGAGVGKSLHDTGQGIGQLVGLTDQADVDASRAMDDKLMGTVGGVTGDIAGQVGQMMLPVGNLGMGAKALGKAAPYAQAAVKNGVFGGLQSTAGDETRLGNTAIAGAGGVLGTGVGQALGKVGTVVKDPMRDASIQLLNKLKIPLHISQTMDSGFLKLLSSAVNKLPFSGAVTAGRKQQEALNKVLIAEMGVKGGNKLSDNVVKYAKRRAGLMYDRLFGRNSVTMDDIADRELFAIRQEILDNVDPDIQAVPLKQIEKFLAASEAGAIPGRLYQSLRKSLSGPEKHQNYGHIIGDIRRVVQDAANRSFKGKDAELLKRTNEQYGNIKIIEKALKQVAGAGGDVKPSALWPLVNQKYGSSQSMREIARAAQLLKEGVPDSGTSQRETLMRILGLGSGVGGTAALASFPLAAKAAATGLVAGQILNRPIVAKAVPAINKAAAAATRKAAPAAAPTLSAAMLDYQRQKEWDDFVKKNGMGVVSGHQ